MEEQKDFMTLVEEHMWHYKTSKVDAMTVVMKKHPEAHRRYIEAANQER